MNTTNSALPTFTVAPTSMRGQSLLQWHETPGVSGLRSLQMPTHIAKAFAAVPDLLAALKRLSTVCAINNAEALRRFYPSATEEELLQLARDSEPMKAARAATALAEGRTS